MMAMRMLALAATMLLFLQACDSDELKACYADCDAAEKRAEECGGPGAADCKKEILKLAQECRVACKIGTE